MKIKKLFFAAAAALAVFSCQNKQGAEGVTVSPDNITFAKEGQTVEVTITTADAWKLSVPEDLTWIEVSDTKGTGTTKISLKAAANDSWDRSGSISVKAGMYSAKIKVSQPGKGEKVDSQIEKLLAVELAKDEVKEGYVDLKDVWFVAKSSKAAIISDGTAMILIYGAVEGAAIGDKGDLKGDLTSYSYRNQVKNAVFTKTGTETINYGTPLNLNEVLDSYDWEKSKIVYVHVKGTMRYDGSKYYNIFLDGRSKDVSLQYSDTEAKTLVDKVIEFNGFFVSGTSHVGVMPVGEVKIDGDAAPDYKINVTAKQTQTGFEASWTAVEDADKYNWSLLKGEANGAKVDGGDVTTTSVSKDVALEVGQTYTVLVKALKGSEELVSNSQSFTARDKSTPADQTVIEVDFTSAIEGFPVDTATQDGTYTLDGYEFTFHAKDKFNQFTSKDVIQCLLIGKNNSYIVLPVVSGKALVLVEFKTGAGASEKVIVDIADNEGTRLNVNTESLKKGTEYSWDVNGVNDAHYRIAVCNENNAQFQYIKLTYE